VVASSGVLAAVACGLYVGRKRSVLLSPRARVEGHYFWSTFAFLLNGIVFLLIGLQLPLVLHGIRNISPVELAISAAQLAAAIILLRLLWVVPATYVGYAVRRKILHQNEEPPSLRAAFILGWTGMRGVVSLAAALSVPATLSNGAPFSQRNPLIFLTFTTIVVTLVLQGLTLPAVIRSLNLPSSNEYETEKHRARRRMISAALKRIEELRQRDGPEFESLYKAFARFYQDRLDLLNATGEEHGDRNEHSANELHERYESVGKQVRQAERSALISLHAHNEISAEVLRELEHELDLVDLRAAG
jgi:CPA1 family monovalent cation:H+ antiporter